MKGSIGRLLVGVVLVGLVVAAPAVRADMTITMETETKGTGPAQKATTTQYYTATKMRTEMGETSASIIDLDEERMITLMPATKMYLVQTFAQLKQMAAAMKGQKPTVEVEKTEEEQEISGYNCQKVIVRMSVMGSQTVMEMWMTTEADIDDSIKEFQENSAEKFKDIPHMSASSEAMKELVEEGFFPIKTVTRTKMPAGTMTTTQTVTKIEKGDLDESLFEIPEGYKEMKMGVR